MATKPVTARTFNGEESQGELSIESFTPAQRRKRTFLHTGLTLLVTLIGALIPVAHFVIVPIGLIATVTVFLRSRSTSEMVTGGALSCPACRQPISILPHPLRIPMKESCEHCHREVIIS